MTCTVKAISRSTSTVKLTVRMEGQTKQYRILAADEKAAGPFAAEDAIKVEILETLAARYDAVKRALSILSFGDNSVFSLQKKLKERGVCDENAKFAARLMLKQGYIKETEQAVRKAVRLYEEKDYGPARIRAKLAAEGYGESDIEFALKQLRQDAAVDFAQKAKKLYEAYLRAGDTPDKAKAKLYRMGY